VTVSERILRGGQADRFGGSGYVAELPEHAPATTNLPHYAEMIREKAALRDLIKVSVELAGKAYAQPEDVAELLDSAAREMAGLGQGSGRRSWQAISEIVDAELLRIENLSKSPGTTTGSTTGFADLDKKLAGLQPTDLVILAARPAMGKTALALNIAQNVALMAEKPVGVFSLEMARGQLVTRMLCCHGLVDAGRVRTGTLDTDDWDRFVDASEYLRKSRIQIDDTPNLSIGDLRARSRRLKAEHPDLSLIVVDYLQLMRGDDARAPREQQISAISRGLKALAKDLECTVLALSQLNRGVESRQDKRPLVSDLRESGAIEQDADVIMFIYRDEYYNPDSLDKGLAEVIIAKQRNGPTGTVKLAFQGQFTRFDNYLDDDVLL
jgi:replicative DNA helicase